MPRLLLALLLLPFLSACDSGEDEISSITITRAQITSVSFEASEDEDEWDDLYLVFRINGTDRQPSTRDRAERVRSEDLVYDFDFGDDIEIVDLNQSLVVQALNREGSRAADILIGQTEALQFSSLVSGTPGSRELESADSEFRVRLNFEYD